jgi:hypothetical protein
MTKKLIMGINGDGELVFGQALDHLPTCGPFKSENVFQLQWSNRRMFEAVRHSIFRRSFQISELIVSLSVA